MPVSNLEGRIMAIKQILLAGALFSLLSGACNAKITPEPTPSRPVDPTWDRIQRTGRILVADIRQQPSVRFLQRPVPA